MQPCFSYVCSYNFRNYIYSVSSQGESYCYCITHAHSICAQNIMCNVFPAESGISGSQNAVSVRPCSADLEGIILYRYYDAYNVRTIMVYHGIVMLQALK